MTARYRPGVSHQARQAQRTLPPQEMLCEFLLSMVKTRSPEQTLSAFQQLFIEYNLPDPAYLEALTEMLLANQEEDFRNLLRRACYILINNWDMARCHSAIHRLIQAFDNPILQEESDAQLLGHLRGWLRNFIASQDFAELRLLTARYEDRGNGHWSRRYTSYLLAPQYANPENPLEQRQVAQKLSQELKDKFKFDLAMYTARSESVHATPKLLANPTSLGDEVLRLIKKVVTKRGSYSYPSVAKLFLQQTANQSYQTFKKSLLQYLFFGVAPDDFAQELRQELSHKLTDLYSSQHDQPINEAILLRTANRLVEYLTIDRTGEPSPLFLRLSSQKNPLVLVILLLKLTLICRNVKTQLEISVATLVQYYESYAEDECAWVIQFLELLNIVMTIYSENVEYNLVNMQNQDSIRHLKVDLTHHRIFSRQKESSEHSAGLHPELLNAVLNS
ncbi:MAG: hypothetical protein MUF49_10950 [Oculatellaceae cyanobacterium Prado106]|nr:hypothetical protein [Oculatellaceae cyanobacterium Prado106]